MNEKEEDRTDLQRNNLGRDFHFIHVLYFYLIILVSQKSTIKKQTKC